MLMHYFWGRGHPSWACSGSGSSQQPAGRYYESRRSNRTLGQGLIFGVRRPLRYMTYQLDLDEDQISQLAGILNRLKTERSQAAVDWERSIADIAAAMDTDNFDSNAVEEALKIRVDSAKRMRNEVLEALKKTHQMLNAQQRSTLAYLLRSGQLSI